MKKTLALVLAIVMALGCMSITAFAADNEATITAEITAADFGYTMVIPTATTLTEANHENVLLGTDGKVSIKDIKHPTDKVNVSYTVDLTNGNLTDGTTTINATYKYKQGANEFAAIDGTTKVTVYANKTVNDSFVNVTANKDQWNAAPAGTYNASVTFNFKKEDKLMPDTLTIAELLNTVSFPNTLGNGWETADSALGMYDDNGVIRFYGTNSYAVDMTNKSAQKKDETTYTYSIQTAPTMTLTFTFNLENGKLASIVVESTKNGMYAGTYVPQVG